MTMNTTPRAIIKVLAHLEREGREYEIANQSAIGLKKANDTKPFQVLGVFVSICQIM